jgi:hypothetical protein
MRDLSIRNLMDMAAADLPDGEHAIEKMFEWHFDRVKTVSQWVLGAAASLSIVVIAALVEAKVKLPAWLITTIMVVATCSGAYGIYALRQLRSLNHHFVAALGLYAKLRGMRDFIRRYRATAKQAT